MKARDKPRPRRGPPDPRARSRTATSRRAPRQAPAGRRRAGGRGAEEDGQAAPRIDRDVRARAAARNSPTAEAARAGGDRGVPAAARWARRRRWRRSTRSRRRLGASRLKDMGKVMAELKARHAQPARHEQGERAGEGRARLKTRSQVLGIAEQCSLTIGHLPPAARSNTSVQRTAMFFEVSPL